MKKNNPVRLGQGYSTLNLINADFNLSFPVLICTRGISAETYAFLAHSVLE